MQPHPTTPTRHAQHILVLLVAASINNLHSIRQRISALPAITVNPSQITGTQVPRSKQPTTVIKATTSDAIKQLEGTAPCGLRAAEMQQRGESPRNPPRPLSHTTPPNTPPQTPAKEITPHPTTTTAPMNNSDTSNATVTTVYYHSHHNRSTPNQPNTKNAH